MFHRADLFSDQKHLSSQGIGRGQHLCVLFKLSFYIKKIKKERDKEINKNPFSFF